MFEGHVTTILLFAGGFTLLAVIGKNSLFRLLFYIIRGALYLLTLSVLAYLILYYREELYKHADYLLQNAKDYLNVLL